MIRRTTWILVAVLAVAVVGAVLWSRRPATTPAGETPTPEPVWQIDSTSIRSIRVEDLQSGTIVEVERHAEEGWHLVQPTPGPADAARVEQSATWLSLPRPTGVLHDATDLAAFGLDKPLKKIVVVFQDGTQQELTVGRMDPTGSVVYVQSAGSSDVLLFSRYGLEEVLGLLDPIPTAPPTATLLPEATSTSTPAPTESAPQPTSAY